jgi:hypothetical protein
LWDNRIDDATALVQAGATSITQEIDSTNDCLAWAMSAVVIENVKAFPLQLIEFIPEAGHGTPGKEFVPFSQSSRPLSAGCNRELATCRD